VRAITAALPAADMFPGHAELSEAALKLVALCGAAVGGVRCRGGRHPLAWVS